MSIGLLRTQMGIIASSKWSIRQTFKASPVIYPLGSVLTFIAGLMPSIQVYLINRLNDANVHGTHRAMTWAVVSGLAIAAYLGLTNVANALMRMAQVKTYAFNMSQIDQHIAALKPDEVSDSATQKSLQNARDGVVQGSVQLQAVSVMSAIEALIVITTLAWTISRVSLLAGVFVCGAVVPMSLANMWFATKDAVLWPEISEHRRVATYNEGLISFPTTASELASLNARRAVVRRATKARRSAEKTQISLEGKSLLSDSLASLGCAAMLIGALVSMLHANAPTGEVTAGIVGIFSGILATSNVGYVIGSLRSGANAIARYCEFIGSAPVILTDEKASASANKAGSLTVQAVTVQYPNATRPAVRDASLVVHAGEVVGLVGANGAGKSTLIKAITHLVPLTSGEVRLDDIDITQVDDVSLSNRASVLAQDYGRYEFTVREFLQLGVGEVTDAQMWSALNAVGFDVFVRGLAEGLETQLGEQWNGIGLSSGQWQRLALARVFLRNASLWILDEPTSAVDAEAEEEIFDRLTASAGDRMTLVVSHRAWTLKNMDRIYVMDDGAIVESGTYAELMGMDGRFAELFKNHSDSSS